MYTDKVPKWDEKEIISILSDIRAQYSIFNSDEFPKYHACSCAIDIIRTSHAHWIEEEDCSAVTDIPWSMCSACGSYSLKLPYCAFCGAKMDEVIE